MNDSSPRRLQDIPVKTVNTAPATPDRGRLFHHRRRLAQVLALVVIVLIPLTGLFRIDARAGAMVIFERQIWFSDFFLVFGVWIFLATMMVFLYSLAGTAFCGWVCPQNTTAEWANYLTRQLLGKRAEVSLDGAPVRVTLSKQRVLNWLLLALSFIAAAMVMSLVPLLYFFPPHVVWSFVSLAQDQDLPGSIYWIYTVFVLICLLDVTVLRHFWCRFICIYRVWQHSFKTRQTLHIAFDASRSADCATCHYCVTQCFIELDPRSTDVFDSCINCGECVDACNRMHAKQGKPGLLRFEFGARTPQTIVSAAANTSAQRNNEYSLLGRTRWTLPFTALGALLFMWGLWHYQSFHLAVDHDRDAALLSGSQYQIAIANKRYQPGQVHLSVSGLAASDYQLDATDLSLQPVEHRTVHLRLSPQLPHGLYRIIVRADSPDGWHDEMPIQHLSSQ